MIFERKKVEAPHATHTKASEGIGNSLNTSKKRLTSEWMRFSYEFRFNGHINLSF